MSRRDDTARPGRTPVSETRTPVEAPRTTRRGLLAGGLVAAAALLARPSRAAAEQERDRARDGEPCASDEGDAGRAARERVIWIGHY